MEGYNCHGIYNFDDDHYKIQTVDRERLGKLFLVPAIDTANAERGVICCV